MSELECELQRQVDELKEKLIAEREAVEACEGCKLTDELRAEIAKRDKGIARLKRRRDELERALEINGRIRALQDGAIGEIARQRDEAMEKLDEYEGRAETCVRLSDGKPYVGSRTLTEQVAELGRENGRLMREVDALAEELGYWRREVELCMQAAYPPSHSPDRGYDPNVMAYPDRHGCTTPSTLVSDVIDGLRDAAQDGFLKAELGDVAELERERDQWKAKAEQARRAMNAAAGKWAKEEAENAKLTRKLEMLKAHGVEIADAVSGGYEVYNEAVRERDEWKTKCETREFAYKQADAERKRYSEQIDELRAELDKWKALAKSYEENYVGPLREAGFTLHAKAVAAVLAAMGEELERTRADREKWRANFGKALDFADEIRRLA